MNMMGKSSARADDLFRSTPPFQLATQEVGSQQPKVLRFACLQRCACQTLRCAWICECMYTACAP